MADLGELIFPNLHFLATETHLISIRGRGVQ